MPDQQEFVCHLIGVIGHVGSRVVLGEEDSIMGLGEVASRQLV